MYFQGSELLDMEDPLKLDELLLDQLLNDKPHDESNIMKDIFESVKNDIEENEKNITPEKPELEENQENLLPEKPAEVEKIEKMEIEENEDAKSLKDQVKKSWRDSKHTSKKSPITQSGSKN